MTAPVWRAPWRRPVFAPVALAEVDLGAGIDDVDGRQGYGAALVLARLHGVPVGVVRAQVRAGRCRGAELRAEIARALADAVVAHLAYDAAEVPPASATDPIGELLGRPHPPLIATPPSISVAVCTRDRPDALASCLRGLAALRPAPFEIIVVDNAPATDATARLVAEAFSGFRYVRERAPGLDRARNQAIAEARGDVVAFTDDDVVADPGWLGPIGSLFARNPEVMAMTGLVLPLELETEAQWLFERYRGFGRGFDRRWYHAPCGRVRGIALRHGNTGTLGTGANMAFRRALFLRIGGFDPALDAGTVVNGGGDLEMFFRTLKLGGTLAYEPAAVVRHRHRRGYDELCEQIESWGTAMAGYLARSAAHFPDERVPMALLRWWLLGTWFARRLALSYVSQPFPRELITRELSGSARGAALYRTARAAAAAAGHSLLDPTARDPAPPANAVDPTPARSARTAARTVDLDEPREPWTDLQEVDRVRVHVRARGRALGEVTIAPHDGTVGVTRLHDELARRLLPALLATSAGEARRRVAAWLTASRPSVP